MSGGTLAVCCPAKVNLVLRVVGRRTDGYHELDTVFQAIDLWDTLTIEAAQELSLVCDDPQLPTDSRNLVLRAARLLRARHGNGPAGARLALRKAIPIEGGLGGGSSDAAAALVACNRFWSLGLELRSLEVLAAELGADVPFFLTGGTARGQGRGDRIERLAFAGDRSIVLGCPPFGIPTGEVFRRVAARLTLPRNGVSVPLLLALKWPGEKDFGLLRNDLEIVVFEEWPELKGFRDALLEAGAGAALLSGSGSVVFGVFSGPGAATRAVQFLQSRFTEWRVLMTRFVREGVRWMAPPGTPDRPDGET